jgi:hypothetical protein
MEFTCIDDPTANGRIPVPGDQRFTLAFPLESGETLLLHMGREGLNHFSSFLAELMVDESVEREN